MNRIEEIKTLIESRQEERGDWYADTDLLEAAQYLLSKLEIAEKALERVDELDDGDPNVSLGKIAREALQQIRS